MTDTTSDLPYELLNNRVLVKIDQNDTVTQSGVHLGKTEGDKTEAIAIRGVVVAVPDEVDDWVERGADSGSYRKVELKVVVGDLVWCAKWEGQKVDLEGQDYLLIPHRHIMMRRKS